jgi:hypothetical protein
MTPYPRAIAAAKASNNGNSATSAKRKERTEATCD